MARATSGAMTAVSSPVAASRQAAVTTRRSPKRRSNPVAVSRPSSEAKW